ncbi:MAG: hypothetical protein C0600_07240 [Ignavibacteria bacterium]|nr:MAG: hypothetical protein C0600_07240 [Ignavibacteria bacterium]
MKKVLSLATIFALAFALNVANAQEKPKVTKKAKSECTTKSSCCDHGAKKTKKMAAKHECGDKCGDDCKMAHSVKSKKEDKKN